MTAIRNAGIGLQAQADRLNVISENLANVNTTGFKHSRAEFSDLLRSQLPVGNAEADDVSVGGGSAMTAITRTDAQGSLRSTGRALDLAIQGDGYFAVRRTDGEVAFTRDGNLDVDSLGRMVTGNGALLVPPVTIPTGAKAVEISQEGLVTAVRGDGTRQPVGQIQIAVFANDGGLASLGNNQFQATPASGAAQALAPGQGGAGILQQGALEASTADVANEMAQLLDAQRSFSMLTRVITTADQMEALANEINR